MYSRQEKERVLAQFHASGMTMRAACDRTPGFPSREALRRWLREEEAGLLSPPAVEVRGRADRPKHARYPDSTRREALRLLSQGLRPCEVARRLGVSSGSVVASWARKARGSATIAAGRGGVAAREAGEAAMAGRDGTLGPGGPWEEWGAGPLPEDPAARAAELQDRLNVALGVLDALKAAAPGSLTSTERYLAVESARGRGTALGAALALLGMPRSTYAAQPARAARPDKYAALRARVRSVFEASGRRYGSESVWAALRRPAPDGRPAVRAADLEPGDEATPVVVSEKVVRRVMREGGLVPVTAAAGRRRYDSYEGEVDDRPPNLPLRDDGTHDFSAGAPGELLLTDVTEFPLCGFKAYLSPAIDCFDGCPVAWATSRHPDAELTCSMLDACLARLGGGFCGHSDGGGCYRSARWKATCEAHGVTRSMSRKGRSPDNARMEGFFGTLKREFFYCRDWTGVTYEEFVAELDAYIVWYRDVKIKKSLGWRSIREYREERGLAL